MPSTLRIITSGVQDGKEEKNGQQKERKGDRRCLAN